MTESDLVEGSWFVTRYLVGEELVEPAYGGEQASLVIEKDRIAGTMGVNRFVGEFRGGLPSSPLAVTRMAGPPEAMMQEEILLRHIGEADHLEADENEMCIGRDGSTTVEFRRLGTDSELPSS